MLDSDTASAASLGFATDVVARCEHYLGGPLDAPPAVHNVRDVAPNKIMMCVSFRVPEAIAFAGREGSNDGVVAHGSDSKSPDSKRQKTE